MFLNPEFEKKLNEYRELIGHIERLAPRTGEGRLPRIYTRLIDDINKYIAKYEKNKRR